MIRLVAAAGLCLALASCASLSPEQCANADWRQIGYADGAAGHPSERIQEHASACAKIGARPDMEAYLAGRIEGLVSYCQPENGFQVGRRGQADNAGDCPPYIRPAFLDQYRQGREINALESQVNSLRTMLQNQQQDVRRGERRIDDIRNELRRSNVSPDRRNALVNEMERMVDRKQDLGRRQLGMQRDLDIAEDRLNFRLREMRR